MPHRHRTTSRPAFSLVELLVVIGIIGLLIALLLPALYKARREARMTQCLTNLRTLGTSLQQYANQNKGRAIAYDPSADHLWTDQLRPEYGTPQLLLCPAAVEPSYTFGDMRHTWGPDVPGSWPFFGPDGSSYTINGWIYHNFPGPTVRLNDRSADQVPAFTDGIWIDAWPRETDPPPYFMEFGAAWTNMGRCVTWRHGRSTNVVFLDGHAARMSSGDLWTLRWNADYKPVPAVALPPPPTGYY